MKRYRSAGLKISFYKYAYVANNPVSLSDVDGRWFDEDGHIINTSGQTMAFLVKKFMSNFKGSTANEGGGGDALNFTYPAIFDFLQNLLTKDGAIGAMFSFVEQLKKAGFEDLTNDKATFDEYEKILTTEAISDVMGRLMIAGNAKLNEKVSFKSTNSFLYKAKSNGFEILVSMKNISSVLEYGFKIGHELNHSITNYFEQNFYGTIGSNRNNTTSRSAFGYFSEYVSYSWESRVGNTAISDAWKYSYSKHGAENIPSLFRYPQNAINQVQQNLGVLMSAYNKFYNNLKK